MKETKIFKSLNQQQRRINVNQYQQLHAISQLQQHQKQKQEISEDIIINKQQDKLKESKQRQKTQRINQNTLIIQNKSYHSKTLNKLQNKTQNKMNNISFHQQNLKNSMMDNQFQQQPEQEKPISSMILLVPSSNYFKGCGDNSSRNIFITQTPRFQVNDEAEQFSSAEQIQSLNKQSSKKDENQITEECFRQQQNVYSHTSL